MGEARTLPLDVSRCSGSSPIRQTVCDRRESCKRYLAFRYWDRAAGIEHYRGISVMAMPEVECVGYWQIDR